MSLDVAGTLRKPHDRGIQNRTRLRCTLMGLVTLLISRRAIARFTNSPSLWEGRAKRGEGYTPGFRFALPGPKRADPP